MAVAVAAASVLLLASLVFAAASTAVEDTVQARKPPPRTISEGRDSNHSTLHTHEHTSDGCLCARPSLTSLVKRVKSAGKFLSSLSCQFPSPHRAPRLTLAS